MRRRWAHRHRRRRKAKWWNSAPRYLLTCRLRSRACWRVSWARSPDSADVFGAEARWAAPVQAGTAGHRGGARRPAAVTIHAPGTAGDRWARRRALPCALLQGHLCPHAGRGSGPRAGQLRPSHGAAAYRAWHRFPRSAHGDSGSRWRPSRLRRRCCPPMRRCHNFRSSSWTRRVQRRAGSGQAMRQLRRVARCQRGWSRLYAPGRRVPRNAVSMAASTGRAVRSSSRSVFSTI